MLGQILDSLDHTLDKLDLLIVVALDSIILQTSFIFRELRDHVFEALARQRRQSLILERDDIGTTIAQIEQRNLTKVLAV